MDGATFWEQMDWTLITNSSTQQMKMTWAVLQIHCNNNNIEITKTNIISDLTCSIAGDCPSFSQLQLQSLMTLANYSAIENLREGECQFYNMTCTNGDCMIGLTWNSFRCIENCFECKEINRCIRCVK